MQVLERTAWLSRSRSANFEASVREELPVLYRVARRLTGNEDNACDLVQQTLLKAFQSWSKFDGRHLRSWLLRILKNEFLMGLRSAPKIETVRLEEQEVPDEGFWDEVIWRDQAYQLLDELEKLPTEYRLAVTLCDLEQMSYDEAALAMEVPVGTVRSRLFRGRALLRASLGGAM